MEDYWHLDFKCPFFCRDEKTTVFCEGGSKMCFPSVPSIKRHFEEHCCHIPGWRTCSVAAMLLHHYEREYNHDNH